MSEQQRTKLSRREMVEIIERGESVIIPDPKSPSGKLHVTRVDDLPDEADLVAGDSAAEEAAQSRLDDEQRALDGRRARLAAARSSAKAQSTAADDDHKEGDTYGDKKLTLEQLSAMSDEQVLAQPGIGEATLAKIRKAQKKTAKK
jgi:hypothetical protein